MFYKVNSSFIFTFLLFHLYTLSASPPQNLKILDCFRSVKVVSDFSLSRFYLQQMISAHPTFLSFFLNLPCNALDQYLDNYSKVG